ncbi:hypothetical protein IP84_02330 [beta proteobacterium AAP99]|nr:hypothetical protein IP84_02330 [beta proteobacterium AAP99]
MARQAADARYAAHAQVIGGLKMPAPDPTIEVRASDFVFVYRISEHQSLVVIVDKSGAVSDGLTAAN